MSQETVEFKLNTLTAELKDYGTLIAGNSSWDSIKQFCEDALKRPIGGTDYNSIQILVNSKPVGNYGAFQYDPLLTGTQGTNRLQGLFKLAINKYRSIINQHPQNKLPMPTYQIKSINQHPQYKLPMPTQMPTQNSQSITSQKDEQFTFNEFNKGLDELFNKFITKNSPSIANIKPVIFGSSVYGNEFTEKTVENIKVVTVYDAPSYDAIKYQTAGYGETSSYDAQLAKQFENLNIYGPECCFIEVIKAPCDHSFEITYTEKERREWVDLLYLQLKLFPKLEKIRIVCCKKNRLIIQADEKFKKLQIPIHYFTHTSPKKVNQSNHEELIKERRSTSRNNNGKDIEINFEPDLKAFINKAQQNTPIEFALVKRESKKWKANTQDTVPNTNRITFTQYFNSMDNVKIENQFINVDECATKHQHDSAPVPSQIQQQSNNPTTQSSRLTNTKPVSTNMFIQKLSDSSFSNTTEKPDNVIATEYSIIEGLQEFQKYYPTNTTLPSGECYFYTELSNGGFLRTIFNNDSVSNGSNINIPTTNTSEVKKEDDSSSVGNGDTDSQSSQDGKTSPKSPEDKEKTATSTRGEGSPKHFRELHTHLLGMGSADFWINFIMKEYLSNDVIFKVESLITAFQLSDHQDVSKISNDFEAIEYLRNIIGCRAEYYSIDNKRSQELEWNEGYTLDQVTKAYNNNNNSAKDFLTKSFEMEHVAENRGKFTPNFYPQKYILKDDMYSQRLDVLTVLLIHTIIHYALNNVAYVEYSVSFKDLKNDHIYQYLTPNKVVEVWNSIKEKYLNFFKKDEIRKTLDTMKKVEIATILDYLGKESKSDILDYIYSNLNNTDFIEKFNNFLYDSNMTSLIGALNNNYDISLSLSPNSIQFKYDNNPPIDFKYYFLCAFNRNSVTVYPEKVKSDSAKMKYLANFDIKSIENDKLYGKFLQEHNGILKLFTNLSNHNISIDQRPQPPLTGAIVGLDWVGDEKLYPFCAFVTPFVKHLADAYYMKTGYKLGLRYHCGENVFLDYYGKLFASHMDITYRSILLMRNEYVKLRIGHGVGFLLHDKNRDDKIVIALSKRMSIYVKQFINDVYFEWCPTSNEYLLHNFHNITIPPQNDRVVVATDNDGIMPIGGMMKEIEFAVTKNRKLTQEILKTNSHKASFVKKEIEDDVGSSYGFDENEILMHE